MCMEDKWIAMHQFASHFTVTAPIGDSQIIAADPKRVAFQVNQCTTGGTIQAFWPKGQESITMTTGIGMAGSAGPLAYAFDNGFAKCDWNVRITGGAVTFMVWQLQMDEILWKALQEFDKYKMRK